MSNSRRGLNFERKIVNQFKTANPEAIVLRSAASKSAVDVVYIDTKAKEIHLIQCKKGKKENWKNYLNFEETNWTVKAYIAYEPRDLRKQASKGTKI